MKDFHYYYFSFFQEVGSKTYVKNKIQIVFKIRILNITKQNEQHEKYRKHIFIYFISYFFIYLFLRKMFNYI